MADVLAALVDDPRFEHSGEGRGSRWRIATEPRVSASWVTQGNEDLPWSYLDPSGVPAVGRRAASA
jgi:hypothetical protein